jgi:Na+/proline symporter
MREIWSFMAPIRKKIKEEINGINKEVRSRVAGYIAAAFGLVAGLAWNEAIKSFIEVFFPMDQTGVLAKFIYAIIITLVLVFVSVYIVRILKGKEEEEQKVKEKKEKEAKKDK